MAFPASQSLLVSALQQAQTTASSMKSRTQAVRDKAANDPTILRSEVLALMGQLHRAVSTWAGIATVPGIVQYARDQFDDQGLDIAAEFTAMQNAAITLRDWIFNNFPQQGGAWLLTTYSVAGEPTDLTFTQAQLAQFVVEADAFIATVS